MKAEEERQAKAD